MGALKVGVFIESFKLGVEGGLEKAAEIGADGFQVFCTTGDMLPENMSQKDRGRFKKRYENLGLVLSATCCDYGQGLGDEDAPRSRHKKNIGRYHFHRRGARRNHCSRIRTFLKEPISVRCSKPTFPEQLFLCARSLVIYTKPEAVGVRIVIICCNQPGAATVPVKWEA